MAVTAAVMPPPTAAAAPVINQNNNQSVEVPVSINVTAAGTDPEAVGRSIDDMAERYLLRTLETQALPEPAL